MIDRYCPRCKETHHAGMFYMRKGKPWTGINADLYQVGAKVSHAGKRWINVMANLHWESGTYGWM